MARKKPNPHCPVLGCKAKSPHANDPAVSLFIRIFKDPIQLTEFARNGMSELLGAMRQDWEQKRHFAWFCRTRQPEELLYRTLYALFFASEMELHHMMSNETPTSLTPYYTKVNDELYGGRGKITEELPGLSSDSVLNTPLKFLHSGAHTAFSALITGHAFSTNFDLQPYAEKLHSKTEINVNRLDWIQRQFVTGLTKDEVREKFRNDRNWRDELKKLKG
jgi:hypothetical protein